MENIIEQVNNWAYINSLPSEIAGFSLSVEREISGTLYNIFKYHNAAWHKSFTVMYDSATKDFLVRTVIGLTEFCDISFFATSLESFEKLLNERMVTTLMQLGSFDISKVDSIVIDTKVVDWQYGKELPQNIAGFTLFIKPYEPIRGINGSYIIFDYSDFKDESSLVVYYNMFRDEFFGELKIKRTPEMISIFDSKTIADLEECVKKHLNNTLNSLRTKLSTEV